MSELTELSAERHGKLRVRSACRLELAENQHVMSLKASEVARAACGLPVFVTKVESTGEYALSAMCGLEGGSNLFVENEEWVGTYMPSLMQSFPLFLMATESNDKGYTVGIDEKSSAFSETDGDPLFDDGGNPSAYVVNTTKVLESGIQEDLQTHHFLKELVERKLLKPIDLLLRMESGETQKIEGLITVHEERLKSCEAEDLKMLQTRGYLPIMHAMLMSIYQLNLMIRRQQKTPGLKRVVAINIVGEPGAETAA